METSNSELCGPRETGEASGEDPVHLHDEEVSQQVGEGEVKEGVTHTASLSSWECRE